MESASKKQRVFSILIDLLVIFIVITILRFSGTKSLKVILLVYFITASYFPAFHYFFGKTPGDIILKLRVVNKEGNKPGFWELTDRFFGVFTKLYVIELMFDSIFMLIAIIGSGAAKDLVKEPLNYERESNTYLVIDNFKG